MVLLLSADLAPAALSYYRMPQVLVTPTWICYGMSTMGTHMGGSCKLQRTQLQIVPDGCRMLQQTVAVRL